MPSRLFADLALSRRLERAEGCANAAFVEARAKLEPGSGATWMADSGAYAMFDSPDSPVTQTFGLGLFEPPTAAGLDHIEAFFRGRRAHVHHEISPLADKSTWPVLAARRYEPIEFTSVMFLDLTAYREPLDFPAEVTVRIAGPTEGDLYAGLAARGWNQTPDLSATLPGLMRVVASTAGVTSFLAASEGCPIASAALNIQNGVALLAGASTVPEARGRGAQRALLRARLRYATEAGCDVAMIGAEPGSVSQRNSERAGFRIAYTRIKWQLPA